MTIEIYYYQTFRGKEIGSLNMKQKKLLGASFRQKTIQGLRASRLRRAPPV